MARNFTTTLDGVVSGSLTPASSGTVGCWAMTANGPGSSVQIYFWNTNATNDAPSLQRFSDNNFYAGFTNAGNTRVVVADTGLYSANVWAHFALTWTSSLQTFYINGVSRGTQAFTFSSPGAQQFCIGNINTSTGGDELHGNVADFAYWSTNLSAAELTALANGARPYRIRTGSLGLWLPLDGRQSPEPDLSGKALNGTVSGATLAFGPPFMPFTPRWPQSISAPPPSVFNLMPQIVT
jgi:hypothetical protein